MCIKAGRFEPIVYQFHSLHASGTHSLPALVAGNLCRPLAACSRQCDRPPAPGLRHRPPALTPEGRLLSRVLMHQVCVNWGASTTCVSMVCFNGVHQWCAVLQWCASTGLCFNAVLQWCAPMVCFNAVLQCCAPIACFNRAWAQFGSIVCFNRVLQSRSRGSKHCGVRKLKQRP